MKVFDCVFDTKVITNNSESALMILQKYFQQNKSNAEILD